MVNAYKVVQGKNLLWIWSFFLLDSQAGVHTAAELAGAIGCKFATPWMAGSLDCFLYMSTFLRSTETRNHKADLEFLRPILCPVAKHGIEMHRTYKCWNVPVVDEQTSFPSDRHHQTAVSIFQIFIIMFFLALGATLRDTGHGAPAASLFANLHPQNAQASAHTVFLTCHSLIHLHAAKCES